MDDLKNNILEQEESQQKRLHSQGYMITTFRAFATGVHKLKRLQYRSDWKLEVWKMMERFGILTKFEARFVDLPNLQFSRLTKPTGSTKSNGLTRLT